MYAGLLSTLQVVVRTVTDPTHGHLMIVKAHGTDGTGRVATLTGLRTRSILAQQATAGLFIDVHRLQSLVLELNLVVFQRLNNSQRLNILHTGIVQHLTALLELLLDDESHTYQRCASLVAKVQHTQSRVTESQEVINKQHTVFRCQVLATNIERKILVFSKRVHHRRQVRAHRRRFQFLGEHHRQLHHVAQHHRRCYTGGFNGHNLVDTQTGKT